MQGVFTPDGARFQSKKALKEAVAIDPALGVLEATSLFGNEYGGPISDAPDGTYTVVGPDPHTSRKWYANIDVAGGAAKVR